MTEQSCFCKYSGFFALLNLRFFSSSIFFHWLPLVSVVFNFIIFLIGWDHVQLSFWSITTIIQNCLFSIYSFVWTRLIFRCAISLHNRLNSLIFMVLEDTLESWLRYLWQQLIINSIRRPLMFILPYDSVQRLLDGFLIESFIFMLILTIVWFVEGWLGAGIGLGVEFMGEETVDALHYIVG